MYVYIGYNNSYCWGLWYSVPTQIGITGLFVMVHSRLEIKIECYIWIMSFVASKKKTNKQLLNNKGY